jgi:hypothetical protein
MTHKDIYNTVFNEIEKHVDIDIYQEFITKIMSSELSSISKKIGIKVTDMNSNQKSDGCYIYLGANPGEYVLKKVKDSVANSIRIEEEDYKKILSYSYLVRIISYLPNSNFSAIKTYTCKLNEVLKKYGC